MYTGKCACGETNPELFYSYRKHQCKPCFSKYMVERGKANKRRMIELKGGKCSLCGFDQFDSALEFHHLEPSKKDPLSIQMRSWTWSRIVKELEKCVLLCRNCHSGVEYGYLSLGSSAVVALV